MRGMLKLEERNGHRRTTDDSSGSSSSSRDAGRSKGSNDGSGDMLWSALEAKYKSHAGFLVEAFVEAVPQAVLQVVFTVSKGEATGLNGASLFTSIFTIVSKGYLVSYALDYLTFFFNFGCVAADCIGLFAVATSTALLSLGGESWSLWLLFVLAKAGIALSLVGGFSLLWFSIFDDHIKMLRPSIWLQGVPGVKSVFFDIYVIRCVGWCLAVVPSLVLFFAARLWLLPLLVFGSVDSEIGRRSPFLKGILGFLNGTDGGDSDRRLRLETLNTFLRRAQRHQAELERDLRWVKESKTQGEILQSWIRRLFLPKYYAWRPSMAPSAIENRSSEDTRVIPTSNDHDSDQVYLMEELRQDKGILKRVCTYLSERFRLVRWLEQFSTRCYCECRMRSALFRLGPGWKGQGEGLKELMLRRGATVSVMGVLICAIPLALVHTCFIILTMVWPFLHWWSSCSVFGTPAVECPGGVGGLDDYNPPDLGIWTEESQHLTAGANATCWRQTMANGHSQQAVAMLPCMLSTVYCVLILVLLPLAPIVARRQLIWVDIVDWRGFPDPFYSEVVLAAIRGRHERDSMLRQRLGHYVREYLLKFLEVRD